MPCHVGKWDECDQLVSATHARFGGSDILVNKQARDVEGFSEPVNVRRVHDTRACRSRCAKTKAREKLRNTHRLFTSLTLDRDLELSLRSIIGLLDSKEPGYPAKTGVHWHRGDEADPI